MEGFKYHNLGHFQYQYPKWNKDLNYVEMDKEELLFMAFVERK